METMQELIPFAKEMLSNKPSRGMLKVYLAGSLLAVLGTVIGLVETVCRPFSSGEPMDAEMAFIIAREQRTLEAIQRRSTREAVAAAALGDAAEGATLAKTHERIHRSAANRTHAS
ncbi:G0/G1 switch protein 2-like [Polymixia lowei]